MLNTETSKLSDVRKTKRHQRKRWKMFLTQEASQQADRGGQLDHTLAQVLSSSVFPRQLSVCANTQTEPATLRNIQIHTSTQPLQHRCLSLLSVCSGGHTWIIRPSLHCWASLKHGGRDRSWLLRLLHFCTSHCWQRQKPVRRERKTRDNQTDGGNTTSIYSSNEFKPEQSQFSGMFVLCCWKLRWVKRISQKLHVVWREETGRKHQIQCKNWNCLLFAVCYLVISNKSKNDI